MDSPDSASPSPAFPQTDASPAPPVSRPRPFWQLVLVVLSLVAGGSRLLAQGQFPGGPQPEFGVLTASPPNIVFDTPTTVTFTIRIEQPTLNPTSVELQRIDAAGQFEATVARMFDNGKSGDQKPGDRLFTARVTFNESPVGRVYFRVTAAFRGNQQNALSPVSFVDVDPFPLPPDPGEAGDQTVAGIDSDADGVRDDVQRQIAHEFHDRRPKMAAANQLAQATGLVLTSTTQEPKQIATELLAGTRCLAYVVGVIPSEAVAHQIRSWFLNTDARKAAYIAYQLEMRGAVFDSPSVGELNAFCRFDPTALPN